MKWMKKVFFFRQVVFMQAHHHRAAVLPAYVRGWGRGGGWWPHVIGFDGNDDQHLPFLLTGDTERQLQAPFIDKARARGQFAFYTQPDFFSPSPSEAKI